MIDDNILESLPSDPEEAFYIFEQKIRADLIIKPEYFESQDQEQDFEAAREENAREYFTAIAAFLDTYGFQVAVDFDDLFSSIGDDFWYRHRIAVQKIQFFSMQCALRRNQKKKAGQTCIYILDTAAKTKIHKYINKICEIISDTDITDWKREALSNRLNAFCAEIDKNRTNLEALASFYVLAKKEIKEAKPLYDQIEKIWEAVSKGGEELWKALPKPKIKGYLNEPQKKIEDKSISNESVDIDDDIPF